MTIDTSLQDTGIDQTGVVLVIFRDPDVPVNSSVVIERTVESASVPDELLWEEIGVLENCDIAGTHFIDELPLTLDKYFYRAKHVANGFVDSDYVFEVSGSAAVIPDIDYSTKPWLLDRAPLQLVMVVSSSTDTQFFVTASVNQPVVGTTGVVPVISAFASSNTGTITKVNNNLFIVDRPAGTAANNPSFVTFTSTAPGFIAGYDKLDLQPLPVLTVDNFLQLIARVSASDANTLGIECSAVNALGVPINFSVSESFNVGTITQDATNRFTIARPVSNIGSVTFQVTSSTPNIVSDIDTVFVQADQSIDPDQFLNLRLTVTSSNLESIGVSASADTTQPYGFGIVSTNNIGGITSDAFGRWTITRPTSGEGSVTFIVTSSNAAVVSDTDTIYVPKDPAPYLTVKGQVTETSITSVTASIDVFDSNNQINNLSGITLTAVSQSLSGFAVSLASGPTQTAGKNNYVYHITRPNYNQGTGRLTLIATKTGYTTDSDSLEIPERVDELAKLRTIITPIGTTTSSVTINVSVLDALPLAGAYINLSNTSTGIPSITPTGSFILSASEAKQFTVTRPTFGSGTGRVNFTATASLRVNDTDSIDVPERSINSILPSAATITLGTVTSGSNNITIPYFFDALSTAEQVQVFSQESSGSAPTIASVEFTGLRAPNTPLYRTDGRGQFVIPIAQPENYVLVTFIPYDFLNRRGNIFTNRYQALSAPLTPPDDFQSRSNLAVGDIFVSNSVQMAASNLPDKIRVYLFGAPYGSDITRTAGGGASQTIIHTGLSPETSYTWEYYPVNNNGAIGNPTSPLTTVTTSGSALSTPVFSYSAQESGGVWYLYLYITNESDYPAGVYFTGEVTNDSLVFQGYTSEQSQFTHFWLTSDGDSGYVRFKASAPGYNDSSFSAYESWFAGSGNPF